jgi:DNA (cytosine-5)-methyltransferase 1
VDNPEKPFTVLEWCAGYGGIGMGLKRVIRNMRTVAYSEIELFCCEVLASRMEAGQIDAAPIWTNIKSFPCERFRGMVDLLVAGYPCQPFSSAGKRKGEEDPRHLWPFIERAISDVRPNWVFCENVAGHLTLGFKDVCHDLDELGYEVAAGLFTAREVGLPHKRQRLFILARDKLGDSSKSGLERAKAGIGRGGEQQVADHGGDFRERPQSTDEGDLAHDKSAGAGLDERRLRRQPDEADGPLVGVGQADSASERRERGSRSEQGGPSSPASGRGDGAGIDLAPAGPGSDQYWWEPARVLGNSEHDGSSGAGNIGIIQGKSGGKAAKIEQSEGTGLGNAPSERPRGGSEDGAGEQSEVPRQGLGDAGAGVGLADPTSKRAGEPEQGIQISDECLQGTEESSADAGGCMQTELGEAGAGKTDGHEAITPLGGSPHGSTDRLDGPDLLAAYHALGSSVHSRVDELRALGNGVIPAVSAKAFLTLYDELTETK